ncbi:MAG TPA: hypothetical protein VKV21_17320 [Solirubrobacteraceae bacterium]|nr:hypothetical protein [Solirubrobacteraceae bacterium]
MLAATILTLAFVPAAFAHHLRIGPLSWRQAHRAAKAAARKLPDRGLRSVKIDGCNQWSAWRIDCVVEADGVITTSTYDPCASIDASGNCVPGEDTTPTTTSCSATIDVRKNRHTGQVTARRERDLSCYGGG